LKLWQWCHMVLRGLGDDVTFRALTLWEIAFIKTHYPTTKAKKTTHIQLFCNYLLGISTIMQLSLWKYGVLINKLQC
jgi:hypothetical protein